MPHGVSPLRGVVRPGRRPRGGLACRGGGRRRGHLCADGAGPSCPSLPGA
ncbi:hypothetical protein SZ55_4623 [Pseudomonas sp. FeS53a]|nr:hypothetical protein SZ55_4623 [Pseudomonas sp. FeS53a]